MLGSVLQNRSAFSLIRLRFRSVSKGFHHIAYSAFEIVTYLKSNKVSGCENEINVKREGAASFWSEMHFCLFVSIKLFQIGSDKIIFLIIPPHHSRKRALYLPIS